MKKFEQYLTKEKLPVFFIVTKNLPDVSEVTLGIVAVHASESTACAAFRAAQRAHLHALRVVRTT